MAGTDHYVNSMLKLWLLLVVVSRAAGVRVPAPPTTAELLLAACKVTRLPEAQRLPAALRLTSTTSVVAAAFEQLPALGCEVGKGGDIVEMWDALIAGLTDRLRLERESGSGDADGHGSANGKGSAKGGGEGGGKGGFEATSPSSAQLELSTHQQNELTRAIVDVLFGDPLLTEMSWGYLNADSDADSEGGRGVRTPQGSAAPILPSERRAELIAAWAETLERPEEEAQRLVESLMGQLQGALPIPISLPLGEKLYQDAERLHAHMRLMVAQSLTLPPLSPPLSPALADALALDVLDAVLGECNLFALESSLMALLADALGQARLAPI